MDNFLPIIYNIKLKFLEVDMKNKTNEELVALIHANENVEIAFMQLVKNLRSAMIKIGRKHLSKLYIYETDDYIQEGSLVLWTLLKKRVYDGRAKFFSLFFTAFTYKCTNLYRDYVLKNLIPLSEVEDFYCYGYSVSKMTVDQYAENYRIEQHVRNKTLYEKKKKSSQNTYSNTLRLEEKRERSRQRSREYYQKNKEKCRAAKHKWYMEHREYALHYQKAYEHGVRIGKKGPCGKRR